MTDVVRVEVEVDSERLPFQDELDEVGRAASQSLLEGRPSTRCSSKVVQETKASPGTPGIVWRGTIPEGDGESPDAEVRVRRLDEHALIVERRLRRHPPGSPGWEATDDELAARAYEQALLHLLGMTRP